MGDWVSDNKGAGPDGFNFVEQPDKWGYLNNPRWSSQSDAVGFSEARGLDIDPSLHVPCGHWHKTISPTVDEDLFVLRGGIVGFHPAGSDRVYKRTKDLDELIWYGGQGAGLDQLNCPSCITCNATYCWICDYNNLRVMKRLKSDLTYVAHTTYPSTLLTPISIHTNGEYIFLGYYQKLKTCDMDLNVLYTVEWGDPHYPGRNVEDITCDTRYVYAAVDKDNEIQIYSLPDLTYVGNIALTRPRGLCCDANYLYATANYGAPMSSCEVRIYALSDLSFVDSFALTTAEADSLACDDDYLYVSNWDATGGLSFSRKYNKTTYALLKTSDEILAASLDTWYPWYSSTGSSVSDEPQVWSMDF